MKKDLDDKITLSEKDKNKGHRQRLKTRFKNTGFDDFSDHEIIELMLFYAIPLKDTKTLAKEILDEFGQIRYLFEASVDEIVNRTGVTENVAILLNLVFSSYKVYLKSTQTMTELKNASTVNRFLKTFYAGARKERFYVLCLDSKKRLIKACLISEGSINETQVYIRNILEDVIKTNATKVILTHNHPSGNATPSTADIESTKQIIRALKIISVEVLDHIIITDDDYFSFKKNDLLKTMI